MKILVSPISAEEATYAILGGADIVDVKNPTEGSLGASFPWVIRQVVTLAQRHGVATSATLGDMPHKPGSISLAGMAVASLHVDYVKVGLQGSITVAQVSETLSALCRAVDDVNPAATVVAAGYADFARFGGPSPLDLVRGAERAGCSFVMLDTGVKDGLSLTDHLPTDQLQAFVRAAHTAGSRVALAGSLRLEDLPILHSLGVDLVGVRGAVCQASDRTSSIQPQLVQKLMAAARDYAHS